MVIDHWSVYKMEGCFWNLMKAVLVMTVCFIPTVDVKFEKCQFSKSKFNPEEEVTRYGKPTAYVVTKSIGISPYSLTDPYRQSALFHEYLLIGPGIASYTSLSSGSGTKVAAEQDEEEIILVVYDEEAIHSWDYNINLVEQNLGKEYLFALINATGMLPSMTIVNTTFEKTYSFHTDEHNSVSYHLAYPNLFRSQETVPPLDVIIEFPAKTRMFQSLKTMIDYQTFGLLRWRLTPADPITFDHLRRMPWELDIKIKDPDVCSKPPHSAELWDAEFLQCCYAKRFKTLQNPCIKDMVIMYYMRGIIGVEGDHGTYESVNKILIVIPMVHDLLFYKGFIDLTEAYCPRPNVDEECGEPLDITLTNDHLLILTDKGLWVSNSLNSSNVNVSYPYSMKPLLKFTPIDPCSHFKFFNCSEVGSPVLARQAFRRQRLFYTPICHLFQYPVYEDMVMLVIDHVSQDSDLAHERDVFTILFAPKPYNDWKVLFFARYEYISKDGPLAIAELLGIFFNHHRRHFDITLLLRDTRQNGLERTIRFVLPLPTDPSFLGYQELNGLLGNGFLEFEFPPSFTMTHLTVNPEPLDIFFLGNSIWIAEAGGPFIYVSVPDVAFSGPDDTIVSSTISSCSFNHPDRAYVCVEKSHTKFFTGRVGVTYSPSSVPFSDIDELRFTMLYNEWPFGYWQYTAFLGTFVAGYSGKIMFWYVYDHNDLVTAQRSLLDEMKDEDKDCAVKEDDLQVKCHVCKKLTSRVGKFKCDILEIKDAEPVYKMISIDPSKLKGGDYTLDGPLVPFMLDGDRSILFEVNIRELPNYKPIRDYFSEVDVGSRIFCKQHLLPTDDDTGLPVTVQTTDPSIIAPPTGSGESYDVNCHPMVQKERISKCEIFIRSFKSLQRNGRDVFLKGFRRILFTTVIDSFPMRPIPTDFVVLVLPQSNEVVIQLNSNMFEIGQEYTFEFSDVGQTLYIPGHFSVFMTGFPTFKQCQGLTSPILFDMSRMVGYATRYYRQGARIQVRPFQAYIIDFGTPEYCNFYRRMFDNSTFNYTECAKDPQPSDIISAEYRKRRAETDARRTAEYAYRDQITQSINVYFQRALEQGGSSQLPLFQALENLVPQDYLTMEDELLEVHSAAVGAFNDLNLRLNKTFNPDNSNPQKLFDKWADRCKNAAWELFDGGCHLRLYLSKNPVLKQNGGRISLDKFDYLSFQVRLRPLTPIGKSLIHRPLIAVTNTNPRILTVEQTEAKGRDIQFMNITLSPTGFDIGVATLTIRPLIVSTECTFADGSITLIVQVHRALGRRLNVNYPIPVCKPESDDNGGYERPWKIDLPKCVTRKELSTGEEVTRPEGDGGQVFYSSIPVNYRPPSYRGQKIPLSQHIYNADPTKPWFNTDYRVSKDSGGFGKCKGKSTVEECGCNDNERSSEDARYTDCQQMAYTATRGSRVDISVEYDRIMRDQDQHITIFSQKKNWSVFLEEVNERREFTLSSQPTPYLQLINSDPHLHQGRTLHDAKTLGVTLHGTGLFHFKVTLGYFESFNEVSGYFMIWVPDDQLNHVQMVVVMLLTITICMAFVFCGFLLVRRRLSSQLPFQTQITEKVKLE